MNCNCSRCGTQGELIDESRSSNQTVLDLTQIPWAKYARPGEVFLCLTCLQTDPIFLAQQSGSMGDAPGFHVQKLGH